MLHNFCTAQQDVLHSNIFASTMCVPTDVGKSVPDLPVVEVTSGSSTTKPATADTKYKSLAFVLGLTTITFLISTIVLAAKQNKDSPSTNALSATTDTTDANTGVDFLESKAASSFYDNEEDNVCAGAKLAFENKLCVDLEVVPPQAGANVTMGYVGNLDVNGTVPNTDPYWKSAMCPVNVHWYVPVALCT